MSYNEITLEQIKGTIKDIESCQKTRDFQKLEEILPLVLEILKHQVNDQESVMSGSKFYAPIWVGRLLSHLSSNTTPLSTEEYAFFKGEVEKLSFSDYKSAKPSLYGYEVQYTSPEGITQVIMSLKKYFNIL